MQTLDRTVVDAPSGTMKQKRSPLAAGGLSRWRAPLSILALLTLPFLLPSQALAVNVLIYGLYAVGYNLLYGYTGLLSFGHAAFFGTGAYVTGIAIGAYGLHPVLAMGFGTVAASALALTVGAVSIRSRGISLPRSWWRVTLRSPPPSTAFWCSVSRAASLESITSRCVVPVMTRSPSAWRRGR